MAFNIERHGDAALVRVDDELDPATMDALDAAISSAELDFGGRIVVSLEDCAYCDSSGLRVLIRSWNRLGDRFGVVVPKDGKCHRVFEVTGIARLPFVFETLAEALRSEPA